MTRINIEGKVDRLSKKVDKLRITQDKAKKNYFKKRRKIVSEIEWKKMVFAGRDDIFSFMPNTYLHTPFFMYPEAKFDRQIEEVKRWWADYTEFLESIKDPSYGEEICGVCILRPKDGYNFFDSLDTMRIKTVVAENFANIVKDRPPASNLAHLEYTCPVVNRFECPYKELEGWNKDNLVGFRAAIEFVCKAIHHAAYLFETCFHADFERGCIQAADHLGEQSEEQPLEEGLDELSRFKITKLQVRTAQDVYDVLTNQRKLRRVLAQYPSTSTLTKADKELLIRTIRHVRHLFTLKNLCGPTGASLEEQREEDQWLEIAAQGRATIPYSVRVCYICGQKWAPVWCVDYQKWFCVDTRIAHTLAGKAPILRRCKGLPEHDTAMDDANTDGK
jgi:hypothetical protein